MEKHVSHDHDGAKIPSLDVHPCNGSWEGQAQELDIYEAMIC